MLLNILVALLILSVVLPLGIFYLSGRKAKSFKKTLAINIVSFFSILLVSSIFLFSGTIQAAEATQSADMVKIGAFFAAALSTSIGSIAAGGAVGKAATAALGALSENDKIMGKALVFVALAEGIAIYGLVLSITILGRV